MSFIETVRRAAELLRQQGRISLRALRREFALDDDALDDLVEELVDVQQVAALEGKVLSWSAPAAEEGGGPGAIAPTVVREGAGCGTRPRPPRLHAEAPRRQDPAEQVRPRGRAQAG